MRIGYIVSDWRMPVARESGSAVHIREMCRALTGLGHDVFIIAGNEGETSTASASGFPPIHEVRPRFQLIPQTKQNSSRSPGTAASGKSGGTGAAKAPSERTNWSLSTIVRDVGSEVFERLWRFYFFRRSLRIAKTLNLDALYERYTRDGDAGIRLARALDIPLLLEVNASRTFSSEWRNVHSPLYSPLVQLAEKRNFSRADHIFTVSSFLKDYVTALGVDENKVEAIHNAVDPSDYLGLADRADEVRKQLGLEGNQVIGFVGSFTPWIDFQLLISTTAKLLVEYPRLHLLLVGDGGQREAIEQQLESEGMSDHATIVGHVPHIAVPAYLGAMDITIAPYVVLEQFHFSPMKLFEYMAAGKAVVASRYADIQAVISEGESGLLVAAGSEEEMSTALRRLLGDEGFRLRLGDRARQIAVESFTWESNARRAAEVLSGLKER